MSLREKPRTPFENQITNNATPYAVNDPGPGSPNSLLYSAFEMREPSPSDSVAFHRFFGNGYLYTAFFTQGGNWTYQGIQCYVLTNQSRPGTVPLVPLPRGQRILLHD